MKSARSQAEAKQTPPRSLCSHQQPEVGRQDSGKSLQWLTVVKVSVKKKTNHPTNRMETKDNCDTEIQWVILRGDGKYSEEQGTTMPISLSLCRAFVTLVGVSPSAYCLEAPTIRILTPASEFPFHFHIKVRSLGKKKTPWILHKTELI